MLAVGLWFGGSVFFTFVVTLLVFGTMENLTSRSERPAWLPLPAEYAWSDEHIDGPKEQTRGSRAVSLERSFRRISWCK